MSSYITKNAEQSIKLGTKLGRVLKPGDCLCLIGNLGSGKTTFIQGVGKGLGIKAAMPSPTFVLVREYPEKNFFHLDLYRIDEKEFLDSGLNQYMAHNTICALEWAEKVKDCWPRRHIRVDFRVVKEDTRKITFSGLTKKL